MAQLLNERIAFLGAGNITEAWVEGLLGRGAAAPEQITASDIVNEPLSKLKAKWNVVASTNTAESVKSAGLVVLAVPPPAAPGVLEQVRGALQSGQIVISLVAALPLEVVQRRVAPVPAVRVMPNTPALVGEAMNLVAFGASCGAAERRRVIALLEPLGRWREVADEEMDLWCALCAVGPTYLLPVLSALAESAAAQGLEPTVALDAAAETFAGTARMVQRSGRTPEQLKLMIGLRTLKEEEARRLFAEAYNEAVQRLRGLGEKLAAAGGFK